MHRQHLWLLHTLSLLILTEGWVPKKNWQPPQRRLGQPILLQETTYSLDEDLETFWRSNPFRVADRVMKQVLNHEANHGEMPLLQATTTPLQQSSVFTRFYNRNVPSHVSCSTWWVRLDIAYNGSAFQSYQKQGADIPTV